MAFRLEIEGTTSTPYVLIDEENCCMKISGKSFNENVIEFFQDINSWLNSYLQTDFDSFTFEFAMSYFNSSTLKVLLNLITKMDQYASDKKRIVINWIADEGNDIIIECGEDFQDEIESLEFNLIINPS